MLILTVAELCHIPEQCISTHCHNIFSPDVDSSLYVENVLLSLVNEEAALGLWQAE